MYLIRFDPDPAQPWIHLAKLGRRGKADELANQPPPGLLWLEVSKVLGYYPQAGELRVTRLSRELELWLARHAKKGEIPRSVLLAHGWVYPHTNGVAAYITRLQAALSERGIAVGLVTLREGDTPAKSRYYAHNPAAFREHLAALPEQHWDVIHAQDVYAAAAVRETFPHTPIVLTIHNVLVDETVRDGHTRRGEPGWKAIQEAEREGIQAADIVTFVSDGQRQLFFREHPQTAAKPWKVVYNGLDASLFFRPRKEGSGPLVLLGIGRLSASKGYGYLLRALGTMRDREWVLHLLGEGPDKEGLMRLAEELGLSERVEFLGMRPSGEIPDVLAEADLFVQPSLAEGLPTTVTEAMFAGLPVLGTRVGGMPEQITSGCGRLVPPADERALAKVLEELMSIGRPELHKMGQRARERALRLFGAEAWLARLGDIYAEVAAEPYRRPA